MGPLVTRNDDNRPERFRRRSVTTPGPARHEGMWTLIVNGGVFPMGILLVFGLTSLGAAFYFALRGDKRLLGFIRGMAAATLFTTLAVSCADVGATLYHTAEVMDAGEPYTFRGHPMNPTAMIVEGLAESTSPGILGFSFLALASMLTAVGRRRLDERDAVR
jgi:hypothetical protein